MSNRKKNINFLNFKSVNNVALLISIYSRWTFIFTWIYAEILKYENFRGHENVYWNVMYMHSTFRVLFKLVYTLFIWGSLQLHRKVSCIRNESTTHVVVICIAMCTVFFFWNVIYFKVSFSIFNITNTHRIIKCDSHRKEAVKSS